MRRGSRLFLSVCQKVYQHHHVTVNGFNAVLIDNGIICPTVKLIGFCDLRILKSINILFRYSHLVPQTVAINHIYHLVILKFEN